MLRKTMLNRRFQMVFITTWPTLAHRAAVSLGTDIGCPLHDAYLSLRLNQSMLMKQYSQIRNIPRRLCTCSHLGSNLVDPPKHLPVKAVVVAHRVVHGRPTLNKTGNNVVHIAHRVGVVHPKILYDALGTLPVTIPQLSFRISVSAKHQHLPLTSSRQ